MTTGPLFTCASCDAEKPLAGARSVDGALWCGDCAEVADGVDEWIAALEVSATAKTRVMHPEMLAALLEAKRQMVEDDEPTLTDVADDRKRYLHNDADDYNPDCELCRMQRLHSDREHEDAIKAVVRRLADDEPTLTDVAPLDFDDEPTRVVVAGGW